MSSFDADSFVSAQDTVADLRDFEDLNEILQVLNNFTIWSESIRLNAKNRIMALVTLHIFSFLAQYTGVEVTDPPHDLFNV